MAPILASACATCASGSSMIVPSGVTPIWPEMTRRRLSPETSTAWE
jgi:hypothetical protein